MMGTGVSYPAHLIPTMAAMLPTPSSFTRYAGGSFCVVAFDKLRPRAMAISWAFLE